MSELFEITQGWTKELGPFNLKNNGVPMDLTGFTIRLMLRGKNIAVWSPGSGQVRIDVDQSEGGNRGDVYYKPAASDFRYGQTPYTIRWEVTDGAGDIVFVPNGEADTIAVYQP